MNYYELLEVSQKASQEVIKAAYKSLMQRYHPDRNPGNAEAAQHAARVVQAYETLCDIDSRHAYDQQLSLEVTTQLQNFNSGSRGLNSAFTGSKKDISRKGNTSWGVWLIIILIILSSWLVITLSSKKLSPDSELREIRLAIESNKLSPKQLDIKMKRMHEILRNNPELLKRDDGPGVLNSGNRLNGESARIIPIYLEQLTVRLRGFDDKLIPDLASSSYMDSSHVLYIPSLGIKIGSVDAGSVLRYMEEKKDYISLKLTEDLSNAKYDELVKPEGEQYLKNIIMSSIGTSSGSGGYKLQSTTALELSASYGVIDISLPEYFSVR